DLGFCGELQCLLGGLENVLVGEDRIGREDLFVIVAPGNHLENRRGLFAQGWFVTGHSQAPPDSSESLPPDGRTLRTADRAWCLPVTGELMTAESCYGCTRWRVEFSGGGRGARAWQGPGNVSIAS